MPAAVLLAVGAIVAPHAMARQTAPLASPVAECMAAELKAQHIPGASVAIVKDGKLLLAQGYGLANLELAVPATDHTVYEIGSMTKQFTAAAILLLSDDGKLSLDDPFSRYVSDTPERWSKITIRQLLNHTTGIPSYTGVGDFVTLARTAHTETEIVKMVRDLPLNFPPGSKWEYSNTNYFLLGMVIEKVSGKSYEALLAERITKPIGATVLRGGGDAIIPQRAAGYRWTGKEWINGPVLQPTAAGGAGELVSDVYDLVKWDAALTGETVLTAASKTAMWTPALLTDGAKTTYGFGWVIGEERGHRLVEHLGGTAAFTTEILRFVDDKLTVIVLTNRAGASPDKIARKLAQIVLPALKPEPVKIIVDTDTVTTERLKKILASVAAGKPEAAEFTPEFYRIVTTQGKQIGEGLARLGPLQSLDPIEQTAKNGTKSYRYRAVYPSAAFLLSAHIGADGKIAGMLLQPE